MGNSVKVIDIFQFASATLSSQPWSRSSGTAPSELQFTSEGLRRHYAPVKPDLEITKVVRS